MTESVVLPPDAEPRVINIRLKALASERFAKDAPDAATRAAWEEIAIEWHALSNRAAQEIRQKSTDLR